MLLFKSMFGSSYRLAGCCIVLLLGYDCCLASPIKATSDDSHWWGGFQTGAEQGFYGRALALTVYNSELYVGGEFRNNERLLGNIARWDGSSWEPLEEGMFWTNPPCEGGSCVTRVSALTVFQGNLIAGGRFKYAGLQQATRRASNIARWDGTRWYNLDSGVNDIVKSLVVFRGELIASGLFTQAGGQNVHYYAKWNGSTWDALPLGDPGPAVAMVEYQGDLIAASNRVARFDGSSWSLLSDQEFQGSALTVFRDSIYANITYHPNGFEDLLVSKWNGTLFEPLGRLGYHVWAMTTYNNRLIATGSFWVGNSSQPRNIASWSGTEWVGLGSGLRYEDPQADGASGLTLAELDGHLFVAGDFQVAGDKTSWNIARWDDVLTPILVTDFTGSREVAGVRLEWKFGDSVSGIRGVEVESSLARSGPYECRTVEPLLPSPEMTFVDADWEGSTLKWYRLRILNWDGTSEWVGPVEIPPLDARPQNILFPPILQSGDTAVEIRFRLATAAQVNLAIFSAQGRLVQWLGKHSERAGDHVRYWNRTDVNGRRVPRGIYFIRLDTDGSSATRKLLILG